LSQPIKIESDRYTRVLAQTVAKAFTDPDFLMTMRFSSLYEAEEFDNALVFASWHFLLETGIAQMKDYVGGLEETFIEKGLNPPYDIPLEQMFRIEELIWRFRQYDDRYPIDSVQNIKIIRNFLRSYNQSLGYGILMYDMHQALLNGRYAEKGGQGRKDVKEVTKTMLQRGQDISFGDDNNGHDRSFTDKLLRRK
jgi:hypothetical protein